MQRRQLTKAQRTTLRKVIDQSFKGDRLAQAWVSQTGCNVATLGALEARGFVETKDGKVRLTKGFVQWWNEVDEVEAKLADMEAMGLDHTARFAKAAKRHFELFRSRFNVL